MGSNSDGESMITLNGDTLVFRFPEVHEHACTEIEFERTLRIPDDTEEYPLPPGLGPFPLRHVEDYKARLPREVAMRGGVLLPMHRAEAMWLWLSGGRHEYPCALKIAAGKINAVSGKPWSPRLSADEDDYVVVPEQPWLDGFCVAKGQIRQFVAMPLGEGYSAEEQISGKAEWGGLQIIAYPMKAERYRALVAARGLQRRAAVPFAAGVGRKMVACTASVAMGLAAGGRMRQRVYADPHGLDAWDTSVSSRCFVTLLEAGQWAEVTGEVVATRPPTAAACCEAGLPWFDFLGEGQALAGAPALTMLKSTAEVAAERGDPPFDDGHSVVPSPLIKLGPKAAAGASQARPEGSSD